MAEEISGLIELENRRRGGAALRGGRVGGGVDLARFERPRAVNNPDVVFRVGRDADGCAQNPVVRERLGPGQVDFKPRSQDGGALGESHGGKKQEWGTLHSLDFNYYTFSGGDTSVDAVRTSAYATNPRD
jgi:hypothetical protein